MADIQNTYFPLFSQLYAAPSIPSRPLPKLHLFSFVSRRELEKDHGDILAQNAADIERWGDYTFTTEDGRTFALFLDGDSIGHRLRAASVLVNRHDEARLRKTTGFIIEVGAGERPLVFEDHNSLLKAWLEHHEAFGVPLSELESELSDEEQDTR